MKKRTPGTVHPHPVKWAPDKLKIFFTDHLNRIYCTRAHLVERLLEIVDGSGFKDIKQPMLDTIAETEEQIARMDGIYVLLDNKYSFDNCSSLISLLEDEFTAIHLQTDDEIMRDVCILSYLQNVENLEKNAIDMVRLAANQKNDEHIIQFLDEYLNRTTARHTLQNFILTKYL